jgi:glyoxylate reductase
VYAPFGGGFLIPRPLGEVDYCSSEARGRPEIEGARKVTLDELLETSDFISIHTPLTRETKHLFDARALAKMKPDAILINTARGPIIDHDALYVALKAQQIGGAALDVTNPEPLLSDHRLFSLDNCLIVPHLGSASVATRSKMAAIAVDNLLCGLAGKRLPHCVNPKVYDD